MKRYRDITSERPQYEKTICCMIPNYMTLWKRENYGESNKGARISEEADMNK